MAFRSRIRCLRGLHVEPIWDAVKKCPKGIYLKRNFRWYKVLSRRMLDIVGDFAPHIEYYSIDEFFFQVEGNNLKDPAQSAEMIRDRINRELRLPVTVGTRTSFKMNAARVRWLRKTCCTRAAHCRASSLSRSAISSFCRTSRPRN
ncbi:MAG: hypothetical protein K8T89_20105 [Planctomycetes bacterium]|nr:hypothetical protein [Planctomycetota bacterium]